MKPIFKVIAQMKNSSQWEVFSTHTSYKAAVKTAKHAVNTKGYMAATVQGWEQNWK